MPSPFSHGRDLAADARHDPIDDVFESQFDERGVEPVEDAMSAPRGADYSHPLYWAPFVLIGNYQ